MKVKFFLENKKKEQTAVAAIVRYKGNRYKLATGISIVTDNWLPDENRVSERKYPDAEFINMELSRMETRISALFDEYMFRREVPTQQQVRNDFKAEKVTSDKKPDNTKLFLPFFTNYYLNGPYKPYTLSKYRNAGMWITKYESEFRIQLTFDDIDQSFFSSFRDWIMQKTYKVRKTDQPRSYSINYFTSILKCIKHVMNVTGLDSVLKLHNNTAFKNLPFKAKMETADTIYLSVDELKRIHKWQPTVENISDVVSDLRFENRMRAVESMRVVKNKFLIGAFTALRVSDFNRLSDVNVRENVIRIKPKKGTGKNEDVVIPIHPVVREILNSGFELALKISDQKINKHIKDVCKLVGINEHVSVSRTEGGRLVERVFEKWQLVTTHTARRSGATNMYLAGIPSISIMKITGHRTENSFLKYIKISQEENAALLSGHAFFKG